MYALLEGFDGQQGRTALMCTVAMSWNVTSRHEKLTEIDAAMLLNMVITLSGSCYMEQNGVSRNRTNLKCTVTIH